MDQPDETLTTLSLVTRDMWGARTSTFEDTLKKPAANVFYSLTYTSICKKLHKCAKCLREMQNEWMNIKKEPDIPYNFMIGYDGRVYEGRGWGVKAKLPKPYRRMERTSIYIVFIAPEDDARCLEMHDAKFDLVEYGEAHGHINPNYLIYDIRKDHY